MSKNKLFERTIKTTKIYKGRIVALREDVVELPGGIRSKREIVEHPGAVAVIALTKDGRIVLVRQFRKAPDKVLLEIPAGLVKKGEAPGSAAKRELEEETGYRAGRIRHLFDAYSSPGYSTEVIRFFLAERLKKTEQNTEEDELIEVVPMALSKAFALIGKGEIKDNKTIVGIMTALWKKI